MRHDFRIFATIAFALPASLWAGPHLNAQQHTEVEVRIGSCQHIPANLPPFSKPVGVNANFYLYYISALANADLSKRGLDWMDATSSGVVANPHAQSTSNTSGWPLEPSTSQITIGGFQRPNRNGLDDLLNPDPNDFIILTFDPGSASPLSTQLTDVTLTGDIVFDHQDTTDPNRTLRYYTCDDSGVISIFLNTINDWDGDLDTDGDEIGDGDGNGGESFDPDIELWVDGDHMAAYQADNSQIWFDQYLDRMIELDPGFVRTGPNWSVNNFASWTELPATHKQEWDPIWTERTLLDDPLWSVDKGVPWELHTSLANELNINLWVCIPFVAYDLDDPLDPRRLQAQEYVEGLAALIRDTLDPNLHCYVEFSNETWNFNFSTNKYLTLNYPGQEAEKNALYADQAFHWWLDEWNDCRVEFVAMGDAADSAWAQTLVDELQACNLVDAVGCAGYIRPDTAVSASWGMSTQGNCVEANQPTDSVLEAALLTEIDANGSGAPGTDRGLTTLLRQHANIAVIEGLRYYVYEGGPSLLAPQCIVLRNTYRVFSNQAPEIGDVVTHELDRFVGGIGLDTVTDWPDDPATGLPFTVEKFGYFAFCQPQDGASGDFLLLTDLYHGTVASVLNIFDAFKFDAVASFNSGF